MIFIHLKTPFMKITLKNIIPLALSLFLISNAKSQVISAGVSITIAPPAMPVYAQPPCPIDGYLWTPGYWAYGPDGYYWVPGVWVSPPRPGFLWTPGYWGFVGGYYGWHPGYWGMHIGYYGGINYGFGYGGIGFVGGMWMGGVFRYNTAVVNVNTTVVHNTYVNKTVINNTTVINRTSFNGPGGVTAQPNAQEQAAMREQHVEATSAQLDHQHTAGMDHNQLASVNHGAPHTVAMNQIGGDRFNGNGHPVQMRPNNRNNENMQMRPNQRQMSNPRPNTAPRGERRRREW
ncbi:MAG: YXWGXW repeat-containing protein [Bacteroidetes bacterium]|nr:YXWGXW repeat-containing protein [Bacteroidota bacterium]MBS1975617.1 YXWGXW repeat-containing protein [Bacteroidota bacterium]